MTRTPLSRSSRRLAAALLALLPALAVPRAALRAQRVVTTLDLAGAQLRYADSVRGSAATVTPAVRIDGDRATFGIAGTLSTFASGWSAQGLLGGSLFTPSRGPLVGELAAVTGGSLHEDGTRTGQTLGVLKAHLMTGARGAWLGGGAGTTWDGDTWRNVRIAEAGLWSYLGPVMALATATPTRVASEVEYVDVELALRWQSPRGELALSGGTRSGDALPSLAGSARSWGGASATAWLTPRLGLVASAGTYPVDLTQGFPGGRYATLGVRLAGRVPPQPARDAVLPRATTDEEPALALRVSEAGDGRWTLRVHAPHAASVEVTGDFTQWQPVALVRAGGAWWSVTLPLARGTHELNVRMDGGRWTVPPGLTPLRDEFGGTTGVFVVP